MLKALVYSCICTCQMYLSYWHGMSVDRSMNTSNPNLYYFVLLFLFCFILFFGDTIYNDTMFRTKNSRFFIWRQGKDDDKAGKTLQITQMDQWTTRIAFYLIKRKISAILNSDSLFIFQGLIVVSCVNLISHNCTIFFVNNSLLSILIFNFNYRMLICLYFAFLRIICFAVLITYLINHFNSLHFF